MLRQTSTARSSTSSTTATDSRVMIVVVITATTRAEAQSVKHELQADVNRAAGMFYARQVGKAKDTPAPEGYKPFYINNYGCPGSYYLDKTEYYKEVYAVFVKADSLHKLTPLGLDVYHRIDLLYRDAKDRGGELTAKGAWQSRALVKQLMERIPEMFKPETYYSVHSVVENRCILTMQDLIGLGHEARMNFPSSVGENWKWRATSEQISKKIAAWLKEASGKAGRL